MTCKECIHYEVCGKGAIEGMDYDQYLFESRCPRVEFDCPDFKPKSNFVEVVRCKDCRRFVDNKEAYVMYCTRELKNLNVKPNDFCSFAEKALKERDQGNDV